MSQQHQPWDSNQVTREYYDSLLIEMRHIDAVLPDTRLTIFNETFDTPITTSALSHLDGCHPGGLAEMAKGAKLANAIAFVGMGEDDEMERIAASGARVIKIIKTYADDAKIYHQIAHAEQCGCFAVGMDFDHGYNGRGEYDVIGDEKMTGKTLEELKKFVASTKLPFVIKGVLSVQDALKCIEAGVQGIMVSHHAGIMNFAVPPVMILPKIVEAVAGRMKIFVDCGVLSGADAFKALALGADAVSVGRPLMQPLSENGAEGVRDKILEYTASLAGFMARTCSPTITQIDKSLIWRK